MTPAEFTRSREVVGMWPERLAVELRVAEEAVHQGGAGG
jgi:hypothetical protein